MLMVPVGESRISESGKFSAIWSKTSYTVKKRKISIKKVLKKYFKKKYKNTFIATTTHIRVQDLTSFRKQLEIFVFERLEMSQHDKLKAEHTNVIASTQTIFNPSCSPNVI
jgi:hypothetical protein